MRGSPFDARPLRQRPKFVAKHVRAWITAVGAKTAYIEKDRGRGAHRRASSIGSPHIPSEIVQASQPITSEPDKSLQPNALY